MKTKILLSTTFIFLICVIQAQIIHVPGDQPTIQEGINAATDGDTVLVAENTYYENIRFMGKAITVASEYIMDEDSLHIVNTIIDGSQASDPDSAAAVMFVNGEDTISIINGFTITGGSGVMNMTYNVRSGGGIYIQNSGCKIMNNMISENHVVDIDKAGGAGISSLQESGDKCIFITNNHIHHNSATANGFSAFGSGISTTSISIIENNVIEYNTCTNTNGDTDGGGIELEDIQGIGPIARLTNNKIRFNHLSSSGTSRGSGIYCDGFTLNISDNVISGNSIDAENLAIGGGIHIGNSSNPVEIINNTINDNTLAAGNSAYGGGIRVVNVSEEVNMIGNSISENTLNAVAGAWGGGIGAYSVDVFNISDNLIENNVCTTSSNQAGGVGINLLYCGETSIENNIINDNSMTAGTYAWGGGILIDKSEDDVQINHNTINNNTSNGIGRGGGISIYNINENVFYTINANKLMNNYSDSWGGAVCIRNTYRIFILNNLFKDNTGEYRGGAIDFFESGDIIPDDIFDPMIANNNFIFNTAAAGGAIYNGYENDPPVIFNSIFVENESNTGQDLFNYSDLDALVSNNILDTTQIFTPWYGLCNLNEDPEFNDTIDYHITDASPCFNSGINMVATETMTYFCPVDDFEGEPRPLYGIADIGADEVYIVGIKDQSSLSTNLLRLVAYPNPFSNRTTIEFSIPYMGYTQAKVFDIMGIQVEFLIDENLSRGDHSMEWDATHLSPGVYYIRLSFSGISETRKLIHTR